MSFSVHGLAVSRGIAIGRAHLLRPAARDVKHYLVSEERVEAEALGQPVGPDQRREAGADVHLVGRVAGQQRLVAPEGVGAALDAVAGHGGADAVVVVRDLERTEVELAHVGGAQRILVAALAARRIPATVAERGLKVYERHCATCHGQTGWGDGPTAASLRVAPANFHRFRSFLKSDEELLRTIEHGVVFSPMHAWTGSLTEGQMVDVLAYVRLLSQQGN